MECKAKRTIEMYKNAAKLFKETEKSVRGLIINSQNVVSLTDLREIRKALSKIEIAKSHTEDRMFSDFPELSNEWLKLFYGEWDGESHG